MVVWATAAIRTTAVQVSNAFNMPPKLGGSRSIAFPDPQVISQYFEGRTGKIAYSETIVREK